VVSDIANLNLIPSPLPY